jgi:Spy/CpxP family protein refolding chaperone
MKLLFPGAMLATALALAQPPPPRPIFAWWDSPIARDLNLKEEQNQQIREVVRSYRNRLIDQRSVMDKAEGELEDAFNEDKVDQKKANEAVEHLANARADMSRAVSQMSLRLRAILTAEQWHELQKRLPKGPPPAMHRPEQGRPRQEENAPVNRGPGRDGRPPREQGKHPPADEGEGQ